MLCFDDYARRTCHTFDGIDQFDEIKQKTKYGHTYAPLATYKGEPFIVGGFSGPDESGLFFIIFHN